MRLTATLQPRASIIFKEGLGLTNHSNEQMDIVLELSLATPPGNGGPLQIGRGDDIQTSVLKIDKTGENTIYGIMPTESEPKLFHKSDNTVIAHGLDRLFSNWNPGQGDFDVQFDDYEAEPAQKAAHNNCVCTNIQLMRHGCRCGGK